jgi:2,3-bisphosphoglycerate-independent phosphoglycerate mutase
MHIHIMFIDGIGLGADDPAINPFASAHTPTLHALAGGHKWLQSTPRTESERAIFIPTDPRLGVPGRPQSGTSQAVILTGRNVPAEVGEHYGPKPNAATRAILKEDNLFKQLVRAGKTASLLDAYPERLHASIARGKTLRSSIQQAAHEAGVPMRGEAELRDGTAFSVDWTGQGWREFMAYDDTPVYTPQEAGAKIVQEARKVDFSFFSHWVTDEVGHRGPMARAVALLELFDGVMAGMLATWRDEDGLIIITSDHGNMEDLSTRHHTEADVPTVIIGRREQRAQFAEGFTTLMDIAPHVRRALRVD